MTTALAWLEGFNIRAAYQMAEKHKPNKGPNHGWVYLLITIRAQLPNAFGDSPYANFFWSLPECILGSPYAFGDPHVENFA